jgi:hypothetical protein
MQQGGGMDQANGSPQGSAGGYNHSSGSLPVSSFVDMGMGGAFGQSERGSRRGSKGIGESSPGGMRVGERSNNGMSTDIAGSGMGALNILGESSEPVYEPLADGSLELSAGARTFVPKTFVSAPSSSAVSSSLLSDSSLHTTSSLSLAGSSGQPSVSIIPLSNVLSTDPLNDVFAPSSLIQSISSNISLLSAAGNRSLGEMGSLDSSGHDTIAGSGLGSVNWSTTSSTGAANPLSTNYLSSFLRSDISCSIDDSHYELPDMDNFILDVVDSPDFKY